VLRFETGLKKNQAVAAVSSAVYAGLLDECTKTRLGANAPKTYRLTERATASG